jgi:type I restriction enzyme S subunit
MGLSTKKEFREAQSRVNRNELSKYKIVFQGDIAFVPTTDTWKVLAFAVNYLKTPIVVSPIYEVFSVDQTKLLSAFLAMWLSRTEFDRYARFNSWGSARENFSFDEMCNVEIPIPSIEIQQDIVNIYQVYNERKSINEKLKSQIKDICPILIKGSMEEAKKEA